MKYWILVAVLGSALIGDAHAQAPSLDPALVGIGFLVGTWRSEDGKVADTGGTSKGSSAISIEANGHVLLRRDHTDLFDHSGKPSGGFDQIMMIYPEQGALYADYSDGSHVIHYDSATVAAGHSVVFTSVRRPGAPTFRLSYELTAPAVLTISFGMAPPGQSGFQTIATGTAHKSE